VSPKRPQPFLKRVLAPLDDDCSLDPEEQKKLPEVQKNNRGMQLLMAAIKRRDELTLDVTRITDKNWNPTPREMATLTCADGKGYLIGGLSNEAIGDITDMQCFKDYAQWNKVAIDSVEKINGRFGHTALLLHDKVWIFGGCYMYNKKR